MRFRSTFCALSLALGWPLGAEEPPHQRVPATPAPMADPRVQKVVEVTQVDLELSAGDKNLTITAKGKVPTGGWSEPTLVRYVYLGAPTDGIWAFELHAKAPEGPATQVLSPVEAVFLWKNIPEGMKAIRVIGQQSEIIKPLVEATHAPAK